ncbi:lipid hydroperoxide peroxidase : Probable thiol peroxidase OS=Lysinibacillus sp. BF-4 GN=tpx PE=3 SV=1: Redoxin [Gemmata massiliana]|uniref:Thioredoxin domain-containing protein n=2 Tax=Gemmata TaxID=113 RepID=A0A6P2D8C1_9BACT|nr:thiol peroxidase [Gemmata massiliana]VTR95720.1 lipid hydroperoxide peroxidase : Probable thiol peroxidase OS=Lysinibacillus sp. BF-4 GN=tpx PE=3 SV=1: Redoxin [Gemmata massiliana]
MARTVTFKGNAVELAGNELKAGDTAPAYTGLQGLSAVSLADTPAKARLFSVVPSLDTGVCSMQTKKFDEGIKALGDAVACYTVSLDLPFAQNRFCTSEGIATMKTVSDVHDHSFGKNWGVLIEKGLPLKLLTRAVFVVDGAGKVTYAEYVPEVTNHPNYDAALAALKAAAK